MIGFVENLGGFRLADLADRLVLDVYYILSLKFIFSFTGKSKKLYFL